MCGRYTLTSTSEIIEEFALDGLPGDLVPRYNIAPTQLAPVVANREQRILEQFRWGLVPRWAKDPSVGNRMINARSETLAEKPAFRDAFRRRRCLVVADGFYEWKRAGKERLPHYIRRRSAGLMAFAGLWERWRDPEGNQLFSFTIVTTDANELVAPIHDRMPVIVEPDDYDRWLAPGELPPEALEDIVVGNGVLELEEYEVSKHVNKATYDDPSCIERGPAQQSLF